MHARGRLSEENQLDLVSAHGTQPSLHEIQDLVRSKWTSWSEASRREGERLNDLESMEDAMKRFEGKLDGWATQIEERATQRAENEKVERQLALFRTEQKMQTAIDALQTRFGSIVVEDRLHVESGALSPELSERLRRNEDRCAAIAREVQELRQMCGFTAARSPRNDLAVVHLAEERNVQEHVDHVSQLEVLFQHVVTLTQDPAQKLEAAALVDDVAREVTTELEACQAAVAALQARLNENTQINESRPRNDDFPQGLRHVQASRHIVALKELLQRATKLDTEIRSLQHSCKGSPSLGVDTWDSGPPSARSTRGVPKRDRTEPMAIQPWCAQEHRRHSDVTDYISEGMGLALLEPDRPRSRSPSLPPRTSPSTAPSSPRVSTMPVRFVCRPQLGQLAEEPSAELLAESLIDRRAGDVAVTTREIVPCTTPPQPPAVAMRRVSASRNVSAPPRGDPKVAPSPASKPSAPRLSLTGHASPEVKARSPVPLVTSILTSPVATPVTPSMVTGTRGGAAARKLKMAPQTPRTPRTGPADACRASMRTVRGQHRETQPAQSPSELCA